MVNKDYHHNSSRLYSQYFKLVSFFDGNINSLIIGTGIVSVSVSVSTILFSSTYLEHHYGVYSADE